MKKIPTLFVRNPDDMRHVTDEVHPDCQWVLNGEGVATRKYDGTCVMFDGRDWWTRREVKPGKDSPRGWVQVDHDKTTGKRVGWEPFTQSGFAHVLNETQFRDVANGRDFTAGTYELVGPKVNGNPERYDRHLLVNHETDVEVCNLFDGVPDPDYIDFRFCMDGLTKRGWEGVVWHHPDGRMAKLKGRDFPEAVR